MKLLGVEQKYESRVKALENKIDSVEKAIKQIEADLYEDDDVDLEPINCPYCNFNFLIEAEEKTSEINCPECGNIIELDWEEDSKEDEDEDM